MSGDFSTESVTLDGDGGVDMLSTVESKRRGELKASVMDALQKGRMGTMSALWRSEAGPKEGR